MLHPWQALRAMTNVVVEWTRPLSTAPGATDGSTRIWLDPRLNQVERRCVLAHELVHLERGHVGCQPRAVERAVRAEAARRLVTTEDLLAALPWSGSVEELAEELWVTPLVLADRLLLLSPEEAEAMERERECPA